jgi:mono/diheme cytochrome c family protein
VNRFGRLALLLAVLALGAFGFTACGGDDEESTTTASEETTTEETTSTEEMTTEDSGGAAEGSVSAGAGVWEESGCGDCHTMAAAGATGTTGPNLDDLQPDLEQVVSQVTNGGGVMPAFGESLSEQQINDVAAYVVASTSG